MACQQGYSFLDFLYVRFRLFLFTLFCIFLIPSTIVLGDLVLTQFFPSRSIQKIRQMPWVKRQTRRGDYTVDSVVGFRPRFHTRRANKLGTFPNKYANSPKPGVKRVLFIGDSVTENGYMLEGLKSCYGEEFFEYWNGGVGSYNIEQVVKYYQAYLYKVHPEYIIFTVHLNDWENTPVVFLNADNSISAFEPKYGEVQVNRFFYLNSNLYHLFLGYFFSEQEALVVKERRVRSYLRKLVELTSSKKLIVLINPTALPLNSWDSYSLGIKSRTIKLLRSENIHFFDMSIWIDSAIEAGVELDGEDIWHPGPRLTAFFAKKLCELNVLN